MNLKNYLLSAGLCLGFAASVSAQDFPVDYSKYPDYSTFFNPDKSFYTYGEGPQNNLHSSRRLAPRAQRPDHVDNSQKKYFPPVFNQAGGSCGSASRICYMFTWELNSYRDLNGKDPKNYYPSHFVWLLTNGNSGKDQFVQFVGVPSAATYGGQTTSSVYGWYDTSNPEFGWMQGYEKWYEAMHNRMWAPAHIPVNVGQEEGREMLKNWLWNHNGDNDFHAGGIAGIGVASGGNWQRIPKTDANDAIGATNMFYVKAWGTSVDHALTIVGYDDRIEFDLDGDGKIGEVDEDEVGAWIVVNSWGAGWCNGGFIYCPYKHAVPAFTSDGKVGGGYYTPEIYHVRKDYKPERTIKLKMDYSRRSELKLSAGISTDLTATAPDQTIPFYHFQYSGDGNYGNTNPAPEVPMLGKWADGKMHTEPMEFGYDLTDLTAGADRNQAIKYFFIVETRSWGIGSGHIYEASIMDYKLDAEGIEIPFECSEENPVEITSAGNKTVISVIVYGDGYTAPRNLTLGDDALLSWDAPAKSGHQFDSYNIYKDGVKIASTKKTEYQLSAIDGYVYAVTALYSDGNETKPLTVNAPVVKAEAQTTYEFTRSGFSIPGVFSNTYSECTIEFLIRPKSLVNWNQAAGPGWGAFYMHANSDGSYTAGWNTGDRISSAANSLKVGTWTHVAIVVKKNKTTIYINGGTSTTITSQNYSGIGGFGDLVFSASNGNNAYLDAYMDEIRIWDRARTSNELTKSKAKEFSGQMLPDGLLAYYKGGTFVKDGKRYLTDVVGGHHAEVLNDGFATSTTVTTKLTDPSETASVTIDNVAGPIVAGQPVTMSAKCATSIQRLVWTCEEAGIDSTAAMRPTFTFPAPGEYTVKATGFSYKGNVVEATKTITVTESEGDIDASFRLAKSIVPAGEHVTFIANAKGNNLIYRWSMPGARNETVGTPAAGATYDLQGTYTVTLTVSTIDGKSASTSQEVEVTQVAPKSDFRISPDVIVKGEKTYLIDESRMGPNTWTWSISSPSQRYIVNGQTSSLVPEKAGRYDVSLTTSNEAGQHTTTKEGALCVCNADSKTGLSFVGYPAAQVTAPNPLPAGSDGFTIEFWMDQSTISDNCDGIGDTESTICLKAYSYGAFVVYVNGVDMNSGEGYILKDGWHHYAITYKNNGNIYFYRDGEKFLGSWMNAKAVPAMSRFRIGGSDMPFQARIDELRVWNRELSIDELRDVCVSPITDTAAAEANGLRLYYDFNQSSGDVQDRTSNAFHGVRTGFGPEGDAWSESLGVFALNFEESTAQDVTATYMKNYKKSFTRYTNNFVNKSVANRFYKIKNWTLENTVVDGTVTTGVHVDSQKNYCFTCTSGWDGFATTLADHKAFQTITLPAGTYTFTAEYDSQYEGQCGNSYLVVAAGTTLPATAQLGEGAIAYRQMDAKTSAITKNELTFSLAEETEVSIGLLINQTGKLCMAIQRFRLDYTGATILTANGETPQIADAIDAPAAIGSRTTSAYDLQGRRVAAPTRRGLYIIDGKKVMIQ